MVADGPKLATPGGWRRPLDATAEDVRWLAWHEARAHALTSRDVRDLGDAWLLYDPTDREPFWNRIAGIAWPSDADGFDRRLTEILALFAGLDRIPHIWPFPGHDEPQDLAARLVAFGFEDHGGGLLMAYDHERGTGEGTIPPDAGGRQVSVERLHRLAGDPAQDAARALTEVLVTSFAVEPERRVAIELETVLGLTTDAYHAILVRVDGQPAAVARRTTFAGGSYLSSIGTAPEFRGLGLGRLTTSLAVADSIADRSRWIYLGVFEENDIAQHLYRSLGFEQIGGVSPDLLLLP
jgi:ribosomal protein S18 acetylase RimI-like enzyme